MTSMSYCRWENTLDELRACNESEADTFPTDLSVSERRARARAYRLMADMLTDLGASVDMEGVEL